MAKGQDTAHDPKRQVARYASNDRLANIGKDMYRRKADPGAFDGPTSDPQELAARRVLHWSSGARTSVD